MAIEDLEVCVKQILCGLSRAALRSIQTLINSQVSLLQAQISVFQTQLLQYDILAIPVEASRDAAQAVITKVRDSAALIPLNLITNCVDLGDFNLNINQSLDIVTATLDDVAFEAIRLLSYRDELNGIISELNATIVQFTDISSVIDQCLAGT